jgi:hypothetical protein
MMMYRRTLVLAASLLFLLGATGALAPQASSVDLHLTTLVRNCSENWPNPGNFHIRACTAIRGGLVDGQFMLRGRCYVAALDFEPEYIDISHCFVFDQNFATVTSAHKKTYGVTKLIVRTALIPCDPTNAYTSTTEFNLIYPDGNGCFECGIDAVDWATCPTETRTGRTGPTSTS